MAAAAPAKRPSGWRRGGPPPQKMTACPCRVCQSQEEPFLFRVQLDVGTWDRCLIFPSSFGLCIMEIIFQRRNRATLDAYYACTYMRMRGALDIHNQLSQSAVCLSCCNRLKVI